LRFLDSPKEERFKPLETDLALRFEDLKFSMEEVFKPFTLYDEQQISHHQISDLKSIFGHFR